MAKGRTEAATFDLGGVKVRPGERAIVDLVVADLSTHTPMTMPVEVVNGRRPGPRLFVAAAVHGDEINGVESVRRLVKLGILKRLSGTLVAVPVVNAFGFVGRSRYLPDRRDLNRAFPGSPSGSLASRLAHLFLREVAGRCTHGIDLHTGSFHRVNLPQVRADLTNPVAAGMARSFGAPVIANARLRPGTMRQAAAERGVPVIVYEAGEALRFDEVAIRLGVRGVVRVMRGLGMLKQRYRRGSRDPVVARSSRWVRAPCSGVLRESARLGSLVGKGEVLGVIGDPYGQRETEIRAPEPGLIIGATNLPLVHEGDALLHLVATEGEAAEAIELDLLDEEIARWAPGAAS